MTRLIFDVDFSDTTCVKAYRKSKVLDIMNRISTSSSIYKTELVVEVGRRGLKIVEVPVEVKDDRPSREVLRKKIQRKLKDLLSARLDRLSLFVGIPFF